MEVFYVRTKSEYCEDGIYEFTKTINTKGETFDVNVFTSGRYIMYLNGEYICEGPCRSSEDRAYFDSVSVKFAEGENVICLKVMHLTKEMTFSSLFKNSFPQILFRAKCGDNEIISDKSWECKFRKNHNLFYPDGFPCFVPPSEDITLPCTYENLEITEKLSFDFDRGFHSDWGTLNGYELMERPIPMIYPGDEIKLSVVKNGDGFIEFDAGKYVTAKIYAKIRKNSNVKIIYSECYEFEDGKHDRCDSTGFLNGPYDIIKTADEEYNFESYWFKAFRFIRVEAEDVEKALLDLNIRWISYPLEIQGKFNSSDETLNKMYEISINTVLCCMHEIIVDCPHYEQQQYAMDESITTAVAMCMSDDFRSARKCIQEFAASQTPKGYLSANYPRMVKQIIPGFSFFWVFMLKEYLKNSNDTEFAKEMIPTMEKMLTFFENSLSEEGLVKRSQYWDFVDWVDGWDVGVPLRNVQKPSTIYSMYYAAALNDAEEICKKMGRCGLASEYKVRYEALRENIRKNCFDKVRGLYTLAPNEAEFSQHTIIWAILSGIATNEEAEEMLRHLFDEDVSPASFSMTFYLFRAIEKCGCYEKYASDLLKRWNVMIANNCTTWCESTSYPRSECHAWSSAPLYEIARNILGVKTGFDEEIVIAPKPQLLKSACGTVPTRFGKVQVSWKDNTLEIKAPKDVKKILYLPSGERMEFFEEQKELNI